jgi:hypothetical protein
MPDFPAMAKPLTKLIMKNQGFLWGTDEELAFESIKHGFSTTPVLDCANLEKPFLSPR